MSNEGYDDFVQLDARNGCGGVGAIALTLAIVIACLGGVFLWYEIEGSRATRAQAQASAESSRAYARAMEARSEADQAESEAQAKVDRSRIEAERQVQLRLDRQDHELALARQREAEFERVFALVALAVSNMTSEELDRLERLLSDRGYPTTKEDQPWRWIIGAGFAALFLGGLLSLMIIKAVRRLGRAPYA